MSYLMVEKVLPAYCHFKKQFKELPIKKKLLILHLSILNL